MDYRQAGPLPPEPSMLPPLRVLVVDDVPVNRELLCLVLDHYGHAVLEADDGAMALERVAAGGIDLVLMDVQIPVLDGLAATRRIRTLDGEPGRTPVWVVSGHSFPRDVEAALAAGANGHLSKPVLFEALHDVLQQIQRLTQTRRVFRFGMPVQALGLPPAQGASSLAAGMA